MSKMRIRAGYASVFLVGAVATMVGIGFVFLRAREF
jgi:hypothetical protein